jgi:tyrosine-specific transport protein
MRRRCCAVAALAATVSVQTTSAFQQSATLGRHGGVHHHVAISQREASCHFAATPHREDGLVLRSSIGEEEDSPAFRDLSQTKGMTESAIRGTNDSASLQSQSIEGNILLESLKEKMGTVSEDRLIHPELGKSGEVSRLFSNIEYKSDSSHMGGTLALHAAGSTLGAAALVAGSTVGAGILALPAATVSSGFIPSTGGLVMAWVYMVMSGLLLAELSMNRIAETGRPGVGILDLYNTYLGKSGRILSSAAYFFLHYIVMTAYIGQGGTQLAGFLNAMTTGGDAGSMSAQAGQALLAAVGGSLLYTAKDKQVEKVNNGLVLGVFVTFLGMVACGVPSMNVPELLNPIHSHPENVLGAAPILFLSLVYHNIVPTIVTQLEGDREKIVKAIVLGTLGPLLMFIMWNGIILGNVYTDIATEASLVAGHIDPVLLLQQVASQEAGGQLLPTLVATFSELAVVTSLISFVYGLVNAWTDVFQVSSTDEEYDTKWKPILFGATLLPPLALSLGNPDIFYEALDFGGAFGVSTLFLFLPPLMAWKSRYGDVDKPIATLPIVPGGKLSLGSLYKVSATLILEQGAEKLGVFDFVKEQWNHGMLVGLHEQVTHISTAFAGVVN